MAKEYWLRMHSDVYGADDFGAYNSIEEACAGMSRILTSAEEESTLGEHKDPVERWFRVYTKKVPQ